jgi:hypothetical protein
MAGEGERTTRATSDPWNIRKRPARLEIRRNFFSNRVVEQWNKITAEIKIAKTQKAFKNGYEKYRGNQWLDQ